MCPCLAMSPLWSIVPSTLTSLKSYPFFKASHKLTSSEKSSQNTPAPTALPAHASPTAGITTLALGWHTFAQYPDGCRTGGCFSHSRLSSSTVNKPSPYSAELSTTPPARAEHTHTRCLSILSVRAAEGETGDEAGIIFSFLNDPS